MDLRLTCGRIDTAICVKGYRVGFLYGIGISALGAIRVILMLRCGVLLKLGFKRVTLVLCFGIVTVVTVLVSEVLTCGIILPRRIRVWAVGSSR